MQEKHGEQLDGTPTAETRTKEQLTPPENNPSRKVKYHDPILIINLASKQLNTCEKSESSLRNRPTNRI